MSKIKLWLKKVPPHLFLDSTTDEYGRNGNLKTVLKPSCKHQDRQILPFFPFFT